MRPRCVASSIRSAAWAVALAAVGGCYPSGTADSGESPPRTVEVLRVRAEPSHETVALVGRIEPWREATLYFEVPGIVAEVLVEEGNAVTADAPLARLKLRDYEIARDQAKGERDAALARLDLLKNGTRPEDLEAARAAHAAAEKRRAFWDAELERKRVLHRRGTLTESEWDEVRRQRDVATEDQRLAKSRVDRAVAGPRKEEISAAQGEWEARLQALAQAERQLEKATLLAPFAGRIEKRLADPGAYVNVFPMGGVPIVQLVDLDQVDAVINVTESLHRRFAVGQSLEVASAVNPAAHGTAKIIDVARVADRASGTYLVRARLDNRDGRFTGGMIVTTSAATRPSRPVLRIPITAARRPYGQPPQVFVVDDKTQQVVAREVTLGATAGDWVEVERGLTENEQVIIRGQHQVVPGDVVRVR